MKYRRIIGMRVDASTYADATAQVIDAAQRHAAFWLSPASVHTVIEAHRSPTLRCAMETANLVTTDGMPLVWSLRWMGIRDAQRVYGPTLTEHVLQAAASSGIPVGFYGSTQQTLLQLIERSRERWPGLTISYATSPPFRPPTAQEDKETIEAMQRSGVRILFVGLGCPRQDLWAHSHFKVLGIPILAVGAAFDFIARTKPQAPAWLQRLGLEWLFRLLSEPRRLWRRYLLGNPWFLLLLAAQLTGLRRFDPPDSQPSKPVS